MLREALEPLEARIDCAFVYGSVARSQEHALSDVDLLVAGDVGLAELAPTLRKAETRLGREINVTNYSTREFRKKIAAKDHFISEILRGPRQFVKGDQHDVDEIISTSRWRFSDLTSRRRVMSSSPTKKR